MIKEFISKSPIHNPPHEIWNGNRDPHEEVPARMDKIEEALRVNDKNKLVYPPEFRAVPIELLKKVHDPAYIDFLYNTLVGEADTIDPVMAYRYPSVLPARRSDHLTEQRNGKLGYYSMDLYTPVHKYLISAALTAASGAYNAALAVRDGGDRTSYAIGRPPGHHAGYDYMAGYCYINNAAVAAEVLKGKGRVAILDVDFHHGNGTEDIFRVMQKDLSDPQVLHISIHANPDRMFPYFSGATTDKSTPLWKGINFALEKYVTDDEYHKVVEAAIAHVRDFSPQYLVVPVGFDTHEDDPIGDFRLTTGYYQKLAATIMNVGLPTVFVQEGGYKLETIGSNITSFIKGIE